ncbi:Polysulfide reductase, NrfD [Poriferisphaera corsica]|uniref:Polysulfide reductase, NrfD n=1 Tax=Poriferisphaera corsica TaxID=2528020 RepID=A0A517YXU4_9BACT|nr:NrfD/PsrC family molybdoenzyme membrane anchor subunit [Poriferisphaera corsica]QDU35052.1 Polysulfide reductase, NrfD [Poriferisphaera corsica]
MSTISNNTHDSYEKNLSQDPRERAPLVTGGKDFSAVTSTVADLARGWPNIWWWAAFLFSSSLLAMLGGLLGYLFTTGTGIWGNNQPVAWGFPIVNFVFWVGIGHAGTLISAILFLFRQNWRTGINRFAEAMTIFAVMCAAIFPGVHVGRPWLAYWLFPIPNQMDMWPQFRSPLLWDVFAVGTYATVSTLFWLTGMVPDFATLRDRAKNVIAKFAYSVVSIGWTGSSRHWHRFEKAYLILAALATPLVLSVHSVVSFDFAVAQLPGWHTTIFPPYFVAGAIYGGFAMVITLAVPCRKLFGLEDIITWRHIENMSKVMLGTGMIVAYAYGVEFFIAWYGQVPEEQFAFLNRMRGPYWWAFALMIFCNCIGPQILWFRKARMNVWCVMFAAMCVNVGMWFERFVIIVTSLVRDFLPSSWDLFKPTWVDITMFIGSFGLFFTMFLLFLKFLPTCAMAEIKSVMPEAHAHSGPGGEAMDSEGRSDYQPD